MDDRGPAPYGDREPADTGPRDLEVRAIAQRFADMADQVFGRLPLYRRICEGAAGDLEVVHRLLVAPKDQRVPNLLLAAVHDLLLAGFDDRLADWYPSIPGARGEGGHRARPVGHGADDPWPQFRRLVMSQAAVTHRLETRSVQTNEVGRSATLLPALFQAALASPQGSVGARPLGIVEVGASAGLNLRFGSYGYRYELPSPASATGGTRTVVESVGAGSRLMLECQLRGDRVPPLPAESLPVATAVGIDRTPLQVTNRLDARWLVACQWPEDLERLDRLREAIRLAAQEPPVVEQGDAVADVAAHLRAVPGAALPVAVASWVLAYLSLGEQQAFLAQLDEVGAERDLALVFAEQPERVPGLPVPPRPDGLPDARPTALVLVLWRAGERVALRLGDQHPHGRWLEWLLEP